MSTTVLGRIEAKFDPKETMIKPSPPGLSTNSSRSGGSGLPSLTLSGPTIIFPFQNNTNRDETFTNAFYLSTKTKLRSWDILRLSFLFLLFLYFIHCYPPAFSFTLVSLSQLVLERHATTLVTSPRKDIITHPILFLWYTCRANRRRNEERSYSARVPTPALCSGGGGGRNCFKSTTNKLYNSGGKRGRSRESTRYASLIVHPKNSLSVKHRMDVEMTVR